MQKSTYTIIFGLFFLIQSLIGCSSEYTYRDINIDDDIGLKVVNHTIGANRLMLPNQLKAFTGVIYQTEQNISQDSLIIDKEGYPIEGNWKLYSGNKLIEEGFYSNGKKDSIWVYYDRYGRVSQKGSFKNGNKHGLWVIYKSDADYDIKETGKYVDGLKQGKWKVIKTDRLNSNFIIEDSKSYIDGVSKEEMVRNEIEKSIKNREYYGTHRYWDNNIVYGFEIEGRNRIYAAVYSELSRDAVYTTSGTYDLSPSKYRLITFDSGGRCYQFSIDLIGSRTALANTEALCYDWKSHMMYFKQNGSSTYKAMNLQ